MLYDDIIEDRKDASEAERGTEAEQYEQVEFAALVRQEYWDIVDAEGWHHVDGHFYSNLDDAERHRLLVAERHVRDVQRKAQWALRVQESAA